MRNKYTCAKAAKQPQKRKIDQYDPRSQVIGKVSVLYLAIQ